jgi:YVTN family beta-propeller protein
VFRTDTFDQVASIPTGALPHGLWPSGDGTRMYVGLENEDAAAAIDTLQNKVIANIPLGQAPQGVMYVPAAVPTGDGRENLVALDQVGQVVKLALAGQDGKPATHVSLFDQGQVQILQASVSGLEPKKPYVLALAQDPKGAGKLEPLAGFMSNPAGASVVNSVGPIRQIVQPTAAAARRYLVIAAGTPQEMGGPVQTQLP